MSTALEQLVHDTMELTGAPRPDLLSSDAPVLSESALTDSDSGPIYLIGLIGGKDVGKSSLVNALVGHEITKQSGWGEGTHSVIAYVHESAADELRTMLSREVPGKFQIVTHQVASLRRQVLLDLPDIDSHWTEHVQITRRMLRHMLFPLWIQSVEKYADQQPQTLLKQVAAGNDPANFMFCLNKVDQLVARQGPRAAQELRDDFAGRIARTLQLAQSPGVYLVSAVSPDANDLPELRRALSHEKSEGTVTRSIELAGNRRERSLLKWLDEQKLSERAARSERLLREAQQLTAARIAVPLMEQALPSLATDPAHRMALLQPAIEARLSRWPIVNVIQTAMSPLIALVRKNLAPARRVESVAPPSADIGASMLDAHFNAAVGRSLPSLIQTTFAQLRQSDPTIAALFEHRRLWDDAPAQFAVSELAARIGQAVERQRAAAVRAVAGRMFALFTPIRWLLTIGAILWFPLAQPVLERVLLAGVMPQPRDLAKILVPLLGASYLLHSAAFLLIWFATLWVVLRWSTHRKLSRLLRRWSSAEIDSELSLTGQCVRWMDELLEPLRRDHECASELSRRLLSARDRLSDSVPAAIPPAPVRSPA